jgi:hypothetical protein
MTKSNDKLPISDLEAMLPWHAAGALDSHQAEEIEKALAADRQLARRFAMVREEMTETILLNEALGAPSARVMENLFKQIDQERKTVRSTESGTSGFGAWFAGLFSQRAFVFAASAAAIVILLQAGVITKFVLEDQGGGPFETASAPTNATRGLEIGSFALVRFAPQANMGDITRYLDSRGAVIVDGPRPGGPGGMYKVRVADRYLPRTELDQLIKDFQSGSNVVVFAAPTTE